MISSLIDYNCSIVCQLLLVLKALKLHRNYWWAWMFECVDWLVSVLAVRCSVCSPYLQRIRSHKWTFFVYANYPITSHHIVHPILYLCTTHVDSEQFALIYRTHRETSVVINVQRSTEICWGGDLCWGLCSVWGNSILLHVPFYSIFCCWSHERPKTIMIPVTENIMYTSLILCIYSILRELALSCISIANEYVINSTFDIT